MEVMMPKQTSPSSFTQPSVETHQGRHPAETPSGIPVSKCLHLKLFPGGVDGDRLGRQSPDMDLILRRIRHHRWANKVRDDAVHAPSGDRRRQLDAEDAFFSP